MPGAVSDEWLPRPAQLTPALPPRRLRIAKMIWRKIAKRLRNPLANVHDVAEESRRINATQNAVDLSGSGHVLAAHGGVAAASTRGWQPARSVVNVVAMSPGVATIEQHKSDLAEQCRRFGVPRLEIFGSATRGDFDPARSDFDFGVSFADKTPGTYADRYLDSASALERLLGRKVDLLTERSIRNPYFEEKIASERRVVYDRRDQEASA